MYNIKEISREMTIKEKLQLEDYTTISRLDDIVEIEDEFEIKPDAYILYSDDETDREKLIIVDEQGEKYSTSSAVFISLFLKIFKELDGASEEYSIVVKKRESKNFAGKYYLHAGVR